MNIAIVMVLAASGASSDHLASVQLTGFPFEKQKPDFCGEADVSMALKRLGHDVSQDQVFAATGLDPTLGRGAYADDLARGLRVLGVEPGQVWFRIDPTKASSQVDSQWRALHRDLVKGQPSIVCMHFDARPHTTEHFRLVTGYDSVRDEVIYQEPAETDGADRRMARAEFLKLWVFKPTPSKWTVIRFELPAPAKAPVIADEAPPSAAEVVQHVRALKPTLPPNSTLVWEKPFLIVGNEAPEVVRERARTIVRRERDLLLKDFFELPPQVLEEVWVLKDKQTYEKYSRELFKTEPNTPYGFYLSDRRALVMNIKPGYGTLTHELFHPFFHQAWPDGPSWLNEGVASLFEQPGERDGHYVGGVNWRLPGLIAGLRAKRVPSFSALVHLSTGQFYEDETGVHYAAARYLCYWLQERGLLARFVRRAIELKTVEKSGWQALTEVLGADPDSFRPEWERFVAGLHRGS